MWVVVTWPLDILKECREASSKSSANIVCADHAREVSEDV